MFGFLARRILQSVPTLLGMTVLAFVLIRLVPGDPVQLLLGERGASPEAVAEIRVNLGLDRPLFEQYLRFLKGVFTGDLGVSIASRTPVWQEFWARFPATVELGVVAMILAVVIGLPVGVLAAVRRNSIWDHMLMTGSLLGYSMPIFWWGLILILFFSVNLGWTPVSGRIGAAYDVDMVTGFLLLDVWWSEEACTAFVDSLRHLILPSLALATIPLAAIARMTRSSLLEVLGEDYIRTAKAKGLSKSQVVWRHGLINALIPIITVVGLMVGTILTGAILTETIFSWPGIGKWMVSSIESRDYPVIQGGLVLISTLIVTVNILVDVLYSWANPNIKAGA